MVKAKVTKSAGKQIHIRLSDQTHRKLRVRAAEDDTSVQVWVETLIEKTLKSRGKRGARS